MLDLAIDLVTRLVSAFALHVDERLQQQGLERPPSLDQALAEGQAWLRATLETLLARPFDEQRRGPLEVFQEAMRFPTAALAEAGIEVVGRDPGATAALPGDVYDLAPASSRQLGDEVWMAHLAWGASKAGALQPARRVGLLSGNLMDRSRIEPPVERAGAKLVVWGAWAAEEKGPDGPLPDLVLVDLTVPGALEAIEGLARAGVRVIAFGPHVDREARQSARRVGADQVLARSVFFENLAELLG